MLISEASQLIRIFSSRLLKTDFYDPTSGDCGPGSVSVCPPAPEEKGGGPGGGAATPGSAGGPGPGKLEHPRSSQHYYRGQDRDYGTRQHPPSRYQEDFRHRPRPGQYRSNSSFNQERYCRDTFSLGLTENLD